MRMTSSYLLVILSFQIYGTKKTDDILVENFKASFKRRFFSFGERFFINRYCDYRFLHAASLSLAFFLKCLFIHILNGIVKYRGTLHVSGFNLAHAKQIPVAITGAPRKKRHNRHQSSI
jgi:hypothetical protein